MAPPLPPHSESPARGRPDEDDEEEDYMSMIIEEPQHKETFAQKKKRQQREAEARAKVPSKAERAAQEAARRDAALSTSTLDPSNKGFQMMAKLGFKPGQVLGKPAASSQDSEKDNTKDPEHRIRSEPLNLIFKEDRGGIGLDSERKRKFLEEAAEVTKKVKQEEGDYRDRVRLERETRRLEAQFHAAQKVAERLDAEAEGEVEIGPSSTETNGEETEEQESHAAPDVDGEESQTDTTPSTTKKAKRPIKPTLQINILYRGLVRERQEKERAVQTRHMLQTSLPSSFFPNPRLPGYEDSTLDPEDHEALGGRREMSSILEQELEEEDPELEEFNALEPGERLGRLVQYLREKHHYCFWCKYRYENAEMEGCPGVTEEDHD
ncbi:putative G-patch domain protein [Aspergillus vadensis CBS 113365]|uniref:G-patch domain protein n=1 Tax=Aspergillus vadensis (strain CBS 113365 / IMI 142717 / IBT 24658) TaxID=1448311 RepID=A0A319CW38_ASPVC|nr:G-patch domain protein [Aspergillus vadensis CBS 113365]PYH72392.1 G-patch domain protein [Aspergillus vadensis CBS 113365]